MIEENLNNLLPALNPLLETLTQYLSGLNQWSMSPADWISIGVAALAAAGSFYSVYITKREAEDTRKSNEKMAKDLEDAENNRTQKIIDADLIANARIEWIQDVRHATAEFVAAAYVYISANEATQAESFLKVQEKKALFVLFFGPDTDDLTTESADALLNQETNNGKNNPLVAFVEGLCEDLKGYHSHKDRFITNKMALIACYFCEKQMTLARTHDKESDENNSPCQWQQEGLKHPSKSRCAIYRADVQATSDSASTQINNIGCDIEKLSEIMSIYIKIEWTRAKTGK